MRLEYRVSSVKALTILVGTTVCSVSIGRGVSMRPSRRSRTHPFTHMSRLASEHRQTSPSRRGKLFDQIAAEASFFTGCLAKNNRHSASPRPLGHHAVHFNSILGWHFFLSP